MNIEKASNIIKDDTQKISDRMRALFYLRNEETDTSSLFIEQAFDSTSVLLKHEAAYVLGQMRREVSIPKLIDVLLNKNEDEIVRHEAGEALGNYNTRNDIVNALEIGTKDGSIPVRETCFLALKNLNSNYVSPYGSRDPAKSRNFSFEEACFVFLNSNDLYERYQAMFFLRNLNNDEAVKILGQGFKDASSLFKHEISFVFGQMKNIKSVPFLIEMMEKENEHGMVRHECAEALGIIGTKECLCELIKYKNSECDILRESVEVAMDLHGYINSKESEYCVV